MDKHVRVYTVAIESRYLYVTNIPSIGVIEELIKRLSLFGTICEFRVLDHEDDVPKRVAACLDLDHTDVVWVQFETVNNARHAKVRSVQKPFYGNILRIWYAPESETLEDTMLKLRQRRELLERRAARRLGLTGSQQQQQQQQRPHQSTSDHRVDATEPQVIEQTDAFIGPRWPPPTRRRNTEDVPPTASERAPSSAIKRRRRI